MQQRVPWLDYLVRHIGLEEIPGPQHEPLIVEWGRAAGIDWWNNDEDAWCAVAVNGALVHCGYPSTRSALARSFIAYGTRLSQPVRGAIVVFPRGPNPLYGHVGIVETVHDDGTLTVVNGNVADSVRRSRFRTASILPDGIRWPPGATPPPESGPRAGEEPLGSRTLRLGARGAGVKELQRALNELNYDLAVDGIYGGRTRDAVRRFAARRGLDADGEADPAILAALTAAVADRRARQGRRETAARAAAPVAGAGAAVTFGATVTSGVQVVREVRTLNDGTVFGAVAIALVAATALGVVLWRVAIKRAEGSRGEDTA